MIHNEKYRILRRMQTHCVYNVCITLLLLSFRLKHVYSVNVMHLTAQSFHETMQTGKTLLIYFHDQGKNIMQIHLLQVHLKLFTSVGIMQTISVLFC